VGALNAPPKFVICSADHIENYSELGFDFFLDKPIEMEKLKVICQRGACKMKQGPERVDTGGFSPDTLEF